MTQTSYLRFPHLTADLLTFVAEDDVWLAELGEPDASDAPVRAWRFTSDWYPARNPRISPDGAQVAWIRIRDGAPEAHVAPVDGGSATRLTYWGDDRTDVLGWLSAQEVLVAGGYEPRRGDVRAHAIPIEGGVPLVLPYGTLTALDVHGPQGAVLLRRGLAREAATWKHYRGGRAGKLWIDVDGSGSFERLLPGHEGNIEQPMWVSGRAAFLSDAEGAAELYSCLPSGEDLRRHTHDPEGFYARQASTDGRRVVFARAGKLWLLDGTAGLDSEARPLDIRLSGTRIGRSEFSVSASKNLSAVATDKTGRASAVEVRGAIHWLTHKDGPARALAAEAGVRSRMPVVLGETGHVAWVTDAGGEWSLEIGAADGTDELRRILTGEVTRVVDLAASPDGKLLAVSTEDNRLLLVEVESGAPRLVVSGEHGAWGTLADDPVFSPDSQWLAWAEGTPVNGPRKIRLADVETLTPVDVTDGRFLDWSPAFTHDGKHLAFLSDRTFDPYYADEVFDLVFMPGVRPYLVPLAAAEPSPFAPELAGRPAEPKKDKNNEDGAPPETVVDAEGMAGRIVPFPVHTGDYTQLRAAKGGMLWLESFKHGSLHESLSDPSHEPEKPRLRRYDFAKRETLTLADEADGYSVSGDGAKIVVRDSGSLRLQPADTRPDNGDKEPLDLDRIRPVVDPLAERRQGFHEAWLLQRDFYWREDLAGIDWEAAREKYAPLVDAVATRDDFVDLLWELQGELGTSHAYVSENGYSADPARRQGKLGADLERDANGEWRLARILPGDSSVPQARSPLEAPGVGARAGDVIEAVDGVAVSVELGPGPLLAGKAGKPVELLLRRDGVEPSAEATPESTAESAEPGAETTPDPTTEPPGDHRRVVIVPLDSEHLLRYRAWVADRRAHVHDRSEGRLGYVHLFDQGTRGWAEFHRDLATETAFDGLVVDTRGNRGGNTSELVVAKLLREVIGWQIARGKAPRTYPRDAVRGPVVSVCDEFTGSDGDIINQALKDHGVPIVGVRTWGGVVGIDGRFKLLDGTGITQPRYAVWFDSVAYGLENHGVEPTVEVEYTPQDAVAGRDPQLDKAVEVALAMLAERPAATPPERDWL